MAARPTVIERAFALAREGRCRTMDDLRRNLTAEDYEAVASYLAGGSIQKQLRALLAAAAGEAAGSADTNG